MKKSQKTLSLFLFSVLFLFILSFASFAGAWKQDAKGYWYQNDDGSYPKSTWMWIPGKDPHIAYCYYFDENGYCLLNRKSPDGYQLSPSGEWLIDRVNLPATKVVNTGNVNANVLPHIANMLYYALEDSSEETKHLSFNIAKNPIEVTSLVQVVTVLSSPYYVSDYFPNFSAKYLKQVNRNPGTMAIALKKNDFKKVASNLFGIKDIGATWDYVMKGGKGSIYNLVDSNTGIFGVGDFGSEDSYYIADSVSVNQDTYTVKGRFAFVPIEDDEPIRKYFYTIVAQENPESDFGHLTGISLDVDRQ